MREELAAFIDSMGWHRYNSQPLLFICVGVELTDGKCLALDGRADVRVFAVAQVTFSNEIGYVHGTGLKWAWVTYAAGEERAYSGQPPFETNLIGVGLNVRRGSDGNDVVRTFSTVGLAFGKEVVKRDMSKEFSRTQERVLLKNSIHSWIESEKRGRNRLMQVICDKAE